MQSEVLAVKPDATSPVGGIAAQGDEPRAPEEGIALCLSGGGYRAMVFHVGALWRLNELGYLRRLDRVSSVSGGSITAAQLGLRWGALDFDPQTGVARRFQQELVDPIRRFAGVTIDWKAVLGGIFSRESVAEKVAEAYRTHLYGNATLQNLPGVGEGPRFVINASNVQSGALWRFSRPYCWDFKVGRIDRPTIALATAVAASAACPPFLSPMTLELSDADYVPGTGDELQRAPFTTRPTLTDGGVYDNLGLETAWKHYRTILVSDAGGKMGAQEKPAHDWVRHAQRVLDLIDNQVRSLRKLQVIDSYQLPRGSGPLWRDGTYWGIRTDIADYRLVDPLPCPHDETMVLAEEATRLAALSARKQERLINWGYAVCDAAMRRHVLPAGVPRPAGFPYPASGVG